MLCCGGRGARERGGGDASIICQSVLGSVFCGTLARKSGSSGKNLRIKSERMLGTVKTQKVWAKTNNTCRQQRGSHDAHKTDVSCAAVQSRSSEGRNSRSAMGGT
ncbi:unnamed protein product, partial [Ectocarpus sp. 12 AP-2014]